MYNFTYRAVYSKRQRSSDIPADHIIKPDKSQKALSV